MRGLDRGVLESLIEASPGFLSAIPCMFFIVLGILRKIWPLFP